MYLVEVFLPVITGGKDPAGQALFAEVERELTAKFGGMTAHLRAPALGLWTSPRGGTTADQIVIIEVMTETIDQPWWENYRQSLEQRFHQERILIRVSDTRMI